MADLYNLDAAIEDFSDREEEATLDQQQEHEQQQHEQQEEWDDNRENDDRYDNNVEVPSVLLEAERLRKRQQSQGETSSFGDGDNVNDEEDEENEVVEDWQQSGASLKEAEQQLLDLAYTRLQHAWQQECRSPELVPLDHDSVTFVNDVLRSINDNAAENDERLLAMVDDNANMKAVLDSLLRIDAERLKFLLADLFKRRLAKIEAHPLYMRNMTDRMSEHEVAFLKDYGAAVERHLQATVTDHFSLAVLKQLDAAEMVDEPDLNCFVFVKCLQDVSIDGILQTAGSGIIVRYDRVRDLLLQGNGQVELM